MALAGVVFLTPLPGMMLLGSALSFLESRYDVSGTASRLDLDVARLRIGVEDLRLVARGHPLEPFLAVDEATVDLPWAAVWTGLSIDDLSLRGVALSVVRGADGALNLPSARGGTGEAVTPRLPIRRLEVSDLTIDWRDGVTDLTLRLPPTSVRLAEEEPGGYSTGPISMDGTARISWRGTATEVSRLEGQIGFDGSVLEISRLELAAPEGELTFSGRVDALADRPRLALGYEAQLDLAHVAAWFSNTVWGAAAVSGDVTGTLDSLAASGVLSAAPVSWGEVVADRVDATVRLTPAAVSLDGLRLEVAKGVLTADGGIAREEGWPGWLDASWIGLDVDHLLATLPMSAPVTVAAAAEGSLSARWPTLDPRSVTLSGENHLLPGVGADDGVHVDAAVGRWRLTLDEVIGGVRVAGRMEGDVASDVDPSAGGWAARRWPGLSLRPAMIWRAAATSCLLAGGKECRRSSGALPQTSRSEARSAVRS